MKLDWKHVLTLCVTPALVGGVNYLVNSASPFSKDTLTHAGLATVLVFLGLVQKSVLSPSEPQS